MVKALLWSQSLVRAMVLFSILLSRLLSHLLLVSRSYKANNSVSFGSRH